MEIKIVYRAQVDEDYMAQQLEFGYSMEEIKADIMKYGTQSGNINDYEVDELPDFDLILACADLERQAREGKGRMMNSGEDGDAGNIR